MIRYSLLFILLLCSSCIQLGGEPQPTRYYLLEAVAEPVSGTVSEPLQVELVLDEFPSYLDRPQLVSRGRNNTVQLAELDRWAEPITDSLVRVLKENLRRQAPAIRISSAPWNTDISPTYLLKISVIHFDGEFAKTTDVDIRWSLLLARTGEELTRQHFRKSIAIEANCQGYVDGLNRSLAELSEVIAATLVSQQMP